MSVKVNSTTVNEVYLNRNVGYTVVGSPTIVDGVVSGFNASNNLKVTGFNANANNFETVIRAKPNSADGLICVGSGGTDQWKILFKSNRLWFIPTKQADSTLKIETTFDTSKFYFIKATKEGSKGTISYSEDGRNWQGLISQDNMSWGSGTNNIIIGYISNYPVSFNGEVDLNHTYIKVNGVTWFNGKQQASPAVNALQINGNTVWQR